MSKRTHTWRHAHQRSKNLAGLRQSRANLESFSADIGGSGLALGAATAPSLSIPVDVNDAVEAQLVKQKRPAPHDPDKVMEDDYGFDTDSMDGFLTGVSQRLTAKGHRFSYDDPFIETALKAKLFELKVKITGKTK